MPKAKIQVIQTLSKEFLTADETMALLDISRNTYDRWRKSGKLKTYRMGRRLYTKYSEIVQELEHGLQPIEVAA